MVWTTTSEVALDKAASDPKSMPDHYAMLNNELSDIVQMVRTDLGELDRMTLGAMVVLDVHNRDVIDYLIKQGVKSMFEFPWLS